MGRIGRRALVAAVAIACAAVVQPVAAPASTTHDLTGVWSCCGSGGAGFQTWTITSMDKSSGAFSGTGAGGSIKMTITGTASGDSVTLVTDYDGSSYAATFKGTVAADSLSMSGSWESNVGQKGTWTATRPTAPAPDSTPQAPVSNGTKFVPGDLYVSDSSAIGGSAVYRVNTANGNTTLVHQGDPFSSVRGIAFGPNGSLFVADFGDGTIDELNLKTGAATRFSKPTTLLYRPWGITNLSRGGNSFMVVSDVTLKGAALVDLETGEVRRYLNGGGLVEPHGIDAALNLTPFVADFGSQGIFRLSTSVFSFKEGPFNQLQDVAVGLGPKGYRFFTSDSAGGVYTWEEPDTRLQRTQVVPKPLLVGPPLQTPTGLALSLDGKTLYIGSAGLAGQGQIIALDLASNKAKVLASGFQTPVGLAVAPPKTVNVKVVGGSSGTSASPSGVTTTVKAPEVALFTVSVSVVNFANGEAARASKAVKVKAVQKPVRAGKATKIRVPFRHALTKSIKAALGAGRKVKAKVTIKAAGASGASGKIVKRVQVKG